MSIAELGACANIASTLALKGFQTRYGESWDGYVAFREINDLWYVSPRTNGGITLRATRFGDVGFIDPDEIADALSGFVALPYDASREDVWRVIDNIAVMGSA